MLNAKQLKNMENSTIEADIRKLHKICAKKVSFKIDGVVTEEFKIWCDEQTEAKKVFMKKYGKQSLTTFVMYSTLKTRLANVPNNLNKSTFKLKNSKGSKFGM